MSLPKPAPAHAPHRLVFTGRQQVAYESFALATPGVGQVALRSLCSLMSTGTENICFNRLFEPGTHWDKWVRYPFYPGYSTVAEVTAVGAEVVGFKLGDRVVTRAGHASHHLRRADECWPAPAGLDPRQAAWFALAKIAAMGARAAEYRIGDSVLVIGAGPIGQMSVRWAAAMGAERISVVDTVAARLALASRGGATSIIAKPVHEAGAEIRAAHHGELPRVVIDGTGHAQVFASALTVVRDRGRVVILGDTGSPAGQHLTSDVIMRGLTIVGAHDCHEDGEWNAGRIIRLFFSLVQSGRFSLDGLDTHVFHPRDCAAAYEVANTRRGETMGILFDWTGGA